MNSDLDSFLETKLGKRIQALIDIDELPIAEIELNRLQNITNDRFKRLILNFSIKNDLSSLQIKTAKYLFKDDAPIDYLYPTPQWIQNYNFNDIDPTIIISMISCLLYTSPSPRDATLSRMPSSA